MDSSYTMLKNKLASKLWNPKFLTVLGAFYLIIGAISFHKIEETLVSNFIFTCLKFVNYLLLTLVFRTAE